MNSAEAGRIRGCLRFAFLCLQFVGRYKNKNIKLCYLGIQGRQIRSGPEYQTSNKDKVLTMILFISAFITT